MGSNAHSAEARSEEGLGEKIDHDIEEDEQQEGFKEFLWSWGPAILALVVGLAFAFVAMGQATTMVVIACWLAAWTIFTALQELWSRLRLRRQGRKVAGAVWGRSIAHIGVGLFIVGVTFVNSYEVEQDIRMREGGTIDIGGYTFRFDGVRDVEGPNYIAKQGNFTVTRDGEPVAARPGMVRVGEPLEYPTETVAVSSIPNSRRICCR